MSGDSRHLLLLNDIAQGISDAESLPEALHGVVQLIARGRAMVQCFQMICDHDSRR